MTISFNLAPGVALGEAIDRIQEMERRLVFPPTITAGFSGTAQVFQQSSARTGLAAAGDRRGHLHRARHSLRELHSPDHDPFRTAGGRRRCVADTDALQDGTQRHRDHRRHHAGRDRQEECDHDDRFRDRRPAQPRRAARAGDPSGLPVAVPTHHDDDNGGDHGDAADRAWARRRRRASPAVGHCRRRRAPDVAIAHPLTSRRSSIFRSKMLAAEFLVCLAALRPCGHHRPNPPNSKRRSHVDDLPERVRIGMCTGRQQATRSIQQHPQQR